MTRADREFVELTSKDTAHDVVEEMLSKSPCRENTKLIQGHETILKNGLKDEVKRLKKWVWFLISIVVIHGVIDKILF